MHDHDDFDTALWIWQGGLMLGTKVETDDIVNAVDKIHNNATKIKQEPGA